MFRPRHWALLLPPLAAAIAYWPALSAGFTGDDWLLLTVARHGGSPLAYYIADHTLAYSYRPNGMLTWWAAVAAFGTNPAAHYAVSALVHAANALLLARLARALGASEVAAVAAGTLFALHPAAIGTAIWLSDRYDLLAVTGVLVAWLGLARWRDGARGAAATIVLGAALAAGSKETSLALLPGALLWLAASREVPRRRIAAALLVAPFALALAVRFVVFGGSGLAQLGEHAGGPLQHLAGLWQWLQWLPEAVAARGATTVVFIVAVCALALVAILAAHRAIATPRRIAPLAALAVALTPMLLQAPITRLALIGDEPFASVTNLRFYYLATAALLLCAATLPRSGLGRGARAATIAMSAVLAIGWGVASWQQAAQWQRDTAGPPRLAVADAVADAVRTLDVERDAPCIVALPGADHASPDMTGFVDAMAKAQLPRDAPAMHCIVVAERPPWIALTPLEAGVDRLPAPLAPREATPLFDTRRVLRLHAHFPGALATGDLTHPHVHVLRWDGRRFVRGAAD